MRRISFTGRTEIAESVTWLPYADKGITEGMYGQNY